LQKGIVVPGWKLRNDTSHPLIASNHGAAEPSQSRDDCGSSDVCF